MGCAAVRPVPLTRDATANATSAARKRPNPVGAADRPGSARRLSHERGKIAVMSFSGISDEALEFYEGLAADNTKTYWTAHKEAYDQLVRGPLVEMCESLEPEFGSVHLFRPYRDVRFAKDKSPYKEQQGATVGHCYLHISASGLFAAVGYYRMAPDQVTRFREAVDDDRKGAELEKVVSAVRDTGYTVEGDTLKTKPRGYPADHPRIELLRHRSLVAWTDFGAPDWLATPSAADWVAGAWRDMLPMHDWLETNVGPSELPPR